LYCFLSTGTNSLFFFLSSPQLPPAAVDVEFLTEFGDLPMMKAYIVGLQSIDPVLAALTGTAVMDITEYQKGGSPAE
jgi:hypothetical protein